MSVVSDLISGLQGVMTLTKEVENLGKDIGDVSARLGGLSTRLTDMHVAFRERLTAGGEEREFGPQCHPGKRVPDEVRERLTRLETFVDYASRGGFRSSDTHEPGIGKRPSGDSNEDSEGE